MRNKAINEWQNIKFVKTIEYAVWSDYIIHGNSDKLEICLLWCEFTGSTVSLIVSYLFLVALIWILTKTNVNLVDIMANARVSYVELKWITVQFHFNVILTGSWSITEDSLSHCRLPLLFEQFYTACLKRDAEKAFGIFVYWSRPTFYHTFIRSTRFI